MKTIKEAALEAETLNSPFILCGVVVRTNWFKNVSPNATTAMLYQTFFTTLVTVNYTMQHLINLDYEPLTPKELRRLETNLENIVFTLHTKRRPEGQVIRINDPDSISSSDWNSHRATIMTTHGWRSAGDTPACTRVRDAYLEFYDCNVIVIDWSAIAGSFAYTLVAKSVPRVAAYVANFVNFMRLSGNLYGNQLKMVGHSLGGHVASLAARIVSQSNFVDEVIALDPAKPMFSDNGPDGRVDASHARHVQVVHTNPGILGLSIAVGTSDFYANGGSKQPGCGWDPLSVCAHQRSYLYYAESVGHPNGFPGTSKTGEVTANMGGPVLDSKAMGYSFDFKTGERDPFSLVPLAG